MISSLQIDTIEFYMLSQIPMDLQKEALSCIRCMESKSLEPLERQARTMIERRKSRMIPQLMSLFEAD